MIEHDHIDPLALRIGNWFVRERTAINGDDETRGFRGSSVSIGSGVAHRVIRFFPESRIPNPESFNQRLKRRKIRAVAFGHPVGDVGDDMDTELREIIDQQRRARRTIDIVIAKDGDGFLALHRQHDPRNRLIHIDQVKGVRQVITKGRVQKLRHRIERDTTPGQKARQQLADAMLLRHSER